MHRLLNAAYFYLRFRPRTEAEMRQYLEKKQRAYGTTDLEVTEAMEELRRQALVNDKVFIAWFIEIRAASKKKSSRLLRYELQRHGVISTDIEQYFAEHELDELHHAIRALGGRWRSFQSLDRKKRFDRAAAFLQRKGFSYAQIKTAIAEYEQKR